MNIIISLVIVLGCIIGSFMATGGYLGVLRQPYELVIIRGAGLAALLACRRRSVTREADAALNWALNGSGPPVARGYEREMISYYERPGTRVLGKEMPYAGQGG